MELNELKNIWQQFDAKLEKSLQLNIHCLGIIQSQKIKSQVNPFLWQRSIELAFHLIAIILLLAFLANNITQTPYAISALALLAFYGMAAINCIQQIVLISQLDYSADILTIQASLEKLKTHKISIGRLSILCLPCFLCFPMVVSKAISDLGLEGLSYLDIRSGYAGNWWSVQLIATAALVPFCIWMYSSLSYKYIHLDWVKRTMQKLAGNRLTKSLEFLQEIETLKKGVI